ncbi:MAG: flagellar hook-basal body complex protein [Rhodospirillaceae bacterium]|nr:flagellar hook-basal body complex protein [Rhodospirillaceae bacterium]
MTLKATFNTAVQGMQAQSQHLSNISTNIANVNTNAYKVQRTSFQTLLNHVRPVRDAKFFSVDTVDTREVDRQGIITQTNRTLDLAINGRGFFVTNTDTDRSGTWQYTRDGALFGQAFPLATDSDGDGQNDQGSYLVTSTGAYVYGWAADENGVFDEQDSLDALTPITINSNEIFASRATTAITLQANVSAEATGRQSVGLPFVDAAGNSRTLTLGFNASLTNNWTLDVSSLNTDFQNVPVSVTPPTVEFDGRGRLLQPANGQIAVTVNDATGPQVITIDISRITQFRADGDLTTQVIEQDGFLQGRLDKTFFDENGVLYGSYTNRGLKPLFKLPIATFAAPNSLDAKSGNFFTETREAGARTLNALSAAPNVADIRIGALETSNVDLADQFTKMIVTQRAYSSSATVLRTADEMTQQARDLKR